MPRYAEICRAPCPGRSELRRDMPQSSRQSPRQGQWRRHYVSTVPPPSLISLTNIMVGIPDSYAAMVMWVIGIVWLNARPSSSTGGVTEVGRSGPGRSRAGPEVEVRTCRFSKELSSKFPHRTFCSDEAAHIVPCEVLSAAAAHRKWCKLRDETSASLTHHPLIRGAGQFDSHRDQPSSCSPVNRRSQWLPKL